MPTVGGEFDLVFSNRRLQEILHKHRQASLSPEQRAYPRHETEPETLNEADQGQQSHPTPDLLSSLYTVVRNSGDFDGSRFAALQVSLPGEKYTAIVDGSYFQIAVLQAREIYVKLANGAQTSICDGSTSELDAAGVSDPKAQVYPRTQKYYLPTWSLSAKSTGWHADAGVDHGSCGIDFDKFFVAGRAVVLEQILDIALDIASGVEALPDIGVLLPYPRRCQRKGVGPVCLPVWVSPETGKSLDIEGLRKADIFSLGVVLWKVLSLGCMHTDLMRVQLAGSEDAENDSVEMAAVLEALKRPGHLAHLAQASIKKRHGYEENPLRGLFDDYTVAEHMADMVAMALGPRSARKDAGFHVANLSWSHMAASGNSDAKMAKVLLYCGAETTQSPPKLLICPQTQVTLDEALALLVEATTGGLSGASAIVGTLYGAFEKEIPSEIQSKELDWLCIGTMPGDDVARRRLKSLDDSEDINSEALR
ncbi:hypothetical protein FGADI_12626 [Fusarium gaditjirri]|uniref:Protein kinase domain-containing protein n=1 Tax=Fusarium gaditjirri TaxID=282569 RepID=A0A8H4SRP5_9HYPO|nr:hypothetical protein FGADI_12626 [Fusarium gaditjirri]